MQNNATKESFKLLQLSDTSKSSELELPEVNIQRKRRIRRKIRTSASPHLRSYNASHKDNNDDMQPPCQNVGLWISVFMSCGWLLILSYMMAVVYTENRRLEVEISKLSTNSQSVPEALQKWHETSKSLAQNQTSISSTLYAIQRRVDDLEKDLNGVMAAISKKDANSEESKISILENNVAKFGAKIVDLTSEVDDLKKKMREMKDKEDATQTSLNKLQESFNNTGIQTPQSNNDTMNAIANLTSNFTNSINTLSTNLSNVTNTMTQKTNALEADVKINKDRLVALQEGLTNLTARVESFKFSQDRLKDSVTTMPPANPPDNSSKKGALNTN